MALRVDCLRPLTILADGPSAIGSFHGGDGARDERSDFVRISSFLFLPGMDDASELFCASPFSTNVPFPLECNPFAGGG